MGALARHAALLSASLRMLAMRAASELALATLQDACGAGGNDPGDFADGLYLGARETIDRCCVDPRFDVARLAAIMGCSRAQLYRLFHAREQGIAATIWSARLQRARRMLCARQYLALSIAEVALRSGFLDASTFSRMFRHRYGMSPRDTREAWMR
jgi:AraC-like DNA-binding protein